MKKEEIKKIAINLKLKISDEESQNIEEDFAKFLNEFKNLDFLKDLDQEEAMVFPFPVEVKMREDKDVESLTTEEVLSGTDHRYLDRVRVSKVVD